MVVCCGQGTSTTLVSHATDLPEAGAGCPAEDGSRRCGEDCSQPCLTHTPSLSCGLTLLNGRRSRPGREQRHSSSYQGGLMSRAQSSWAASAVDSAASRSGAASACLQCPLALARVLDAAGVPAAPHPPPAYTATLAAQRRCTVRRAVNR